MAWFGLPKRTEYILRSLSCMAKSNSRLPVRAIAACEGIPASFLAKILYQLTWHGVVTSKRGSGGGFRLALPPEQIRVKKVLEISQVPAANLSEAKLGHDSSEAWEKLWEPSRQTLETLTLADLLRTELGSAGCERGTGLEAGPQRKSSTAPPKGTAMSFRFTDLIRRDMIVRYIRNRYPQTQEVFKRFGVRTPCWDCSLVEVAHRSGVSVEELLAALDEVVVPRIRAEQERRDES